MCGFSKGMTHCEVSIYFRKYFISWTSQLRPRFRHKMQSFFFAETNFSRSYHYSNVDSHPYTVQHWNFGTIWRLAAYNNQSPISSTSATHQFSFYSSIIWFIHHTLLLPLCFNFLNQYISIASPDFVKHYSTNVSLKWEKKLSKKLKTKNVLKLRN